MLEALIFVVFPFCMAYAAISDILSMTISNKVPMVLVAAFLLVAPLSGMEISAIGMHLLAGLAVLSVTFALFAFGGMGGGDAKLIAASAVWFGFSFELGLYLVFASLIGGVLTIGLLKLRSSIVGGMVIGNPLMRHLADPKAGIPYGIALGIGGLIAYPETPLVQWALERAASF